jgi:hypothetical protein
MKRMMILMLLLLFMALSRTDVQAQVVIGAGDDPPHSSAVLELRSSTAGLLLPQVKLDADDDQSLLTNPENGMLVCNLTGALKHGVYYWKDTKWELFIEL